MAGGVDYSALRARTMGSGNDEEAVTVNTRALIDKVLARYSGEWTVLRELLQNAADASAKKISIKFETIPSATVPLPQSTNTTSSLKHTLSHHTLRRLIVTNDGQPFNDNDWSRLKRIAEGNPDETKIGAFGVGFYSVFADCEEPFVSSGKEAMAFYWKGNSLFTRRLQLDPSEASPKTSFVLDYRNSTSPIPALLPLCQFLASSLTFVGIENVELLLDEWKIFSLCKKTAPSVDIAIPKDVETKTGEGMMKILSVTREVAQLDGSWMNIVGWKRARNASGLFEGQRGADNAPSLKSFFSRLAGNNNAPEKATRSSTPVPNTADEDLSIQSSSSVFLYSNTATTRTSTTHSFNQELERATKKPPPKTTKLAVLTSSYEAEVASSGAKTRAASGSLDVFANVLPSRSGRIFIGFSTHQTTGLSAHISAPSIIPTVERESIDLNARWVRTWNLEILRAAGIVCRIAWANEMALVRDRVVRAASDAGKSKIRREHISGVVQDATHTTNQFSFSESTPLSQVGQVIEDSFWTCSKKASIDVLSTCGVLPSHAIRIAPKDLSFMEGIPVLPDELVEGAKAFVTKLTDFGLVTEVSVTDIKKALESNALSSKQLGEFLAWLSSKAQSGDIEGKTVQSLLDVAVANNEGPDGTSTQVLVLGEIKTYLTATKIPVDMPVPGTVMPFKFTKTLTRHELEAIGWSELQIIPWVRWLLENARDRSILNETQDITLSPAFAAQVMPVLSKQWDGLSQSSKGTLVELLETRPVIPTRLGMKKPPETYFPSVQLFDDLPLVKGLNGVKEKFLMALGVRKTVELGVVFDRLLSASPDYPRDKTVTSQGSHVALIRYLASVKDDIPSKDIQRLRTTPVCPAELRGEVAGPTRQRFVVSELFEPKSTLRELGLPILYWPDAYRPNSPEGRFLSMLGLKTFPPVAEMIEIMAQAAKSGDMALRDNALGYFLASHHVNGYAAFDHAGVMTTYLPVQGSDKLSRPGRCFTDEGASLLGFDILRRDLQPHAQKFGVRTHPPMDECVAILIQKPPTTHREARIMFTYFAGRLAEINASYADILGQSNIVPTTRSSEKAPLLRHIPPRNCFLGESDTYRDIFDFVDFGQEANAFLVKCGSKNEPTNLEVARMLVKEPARISAAFQNAEKYLNLLRRLAHSVSTLKRDTELFREMKRAPFLLASKDLAVPSTAQAKSQNMVEEVDDYDDESQGIREWQLTSAQNAIIVDEFVSFNLFKSDILAAPQEERLEEFYYSLGTPLLSTLVEESARHSAILPDQKGASRLQKQIFERCKLFLHEQPQDHIKHDAKWLEKNLKVQAVQSISLRRSLKARNVSHVEKRSAVVTHANREYILWITAGSTDLYQVSQALVHLLLSRPKVHSAITLEMLLSRDLLELRARGFNVSRILRQKAAEARMAEGRRQQQLEEERARINREEAAWKEAQEQSNGQNANVPGGFPDSPDAKSAALTTQDVDESPFSDGSIRRPGGLFSNLTRRFGLDDGGRASRHIQSLMGNNTATSTSHNDARSAQGELPPPPYSASDPQGSKGQTTQPVTAPHHLQQNLLSAIQKSRPHNSNELFSRGESTQVKETTSYCDDHPSHDLAFVATATSGIQIFVSKTTANSSSFLSDNLQGLNEFSAVLVDIAAIFAMRKESINIFFDANGKTIGFNRNGSIFCNYLYFQQLHQVKVMQDGGKTDALVYWWVIVCHELAHNLVEDHSSNHSYYTEGFVQQYFGKVMARIADYPQAKLSGNVPRLAAQAHREDSLLD